MTSFLVGATTTLGQLDARGNKETMRQTERDRIGEQEQRKANVKKKTE